MPESIPEALPVCRRCGLPITRNQRRVGVPEMGTTVAHLRCGDLERAEEGLPRRVLPRARWR